MSAEQTAHANPVVVKSKPVPKNPAPPISSADDPVWATTRIEMAQAIWGEGFCTPGGVDFALSLAKYFSPLVKGMNFLDVNANLGGNLNWIATKYELNAQGCESHQALQRSSKEYLAKSGAGGINIRFCDENKIEIAKDAFDCILAREYLFQKTDKKYFIDQICDGLKERGQLIITDLVRLKPGDPSKDLKNWMELALIPVHLSDVQTTVGYLKSRGDMEIRAVDDISSRYRQEIVNGWKRYLDTVVHDVPDESYLPWMLREVKIWAGLVQMLQSGEIGLCRIYGRRKPAMERKTL